MWGKAPTEETPHHHQTSALHGHIRSRPIILGNAAPPDKGPLALRGVGPVVLPMVSKASEVPRRRGHVVDVPPHCVCGCDVVNGVLDGCTRTRGILPHHIPNLPGRKVDGGGGQWRTGIIANRVWTAHVPSLREDSGRGVGNVITRPEESCRAHRCWSGASGERT